MTDIAACFWIMKRHPFNFECIKERTKREFFKPLIVDTWGLSLLLGPF